jgi:hypothetical protein
VLQLHHVSLQASKIACEIFGSHSAVDEGSSLLGRFDLEDEVTTHLCDVKDYLPIGTASQKTSISSSMTLKRTEKAELLLKMRQQQKSVIGNCLLQTVPLHMLSYRRLTLYMLKRIKAGTKNRRRVIKRN